MSSSAPLHVRYRYDGKILYLIRCHLGTVCDEIRGESSVRVSENSKQIVQKGPRTPAGGCRRFGSGTIRNYAVQTTSTFALRPHSRIVV